MCMYIYIYVCMYVCLHVSNANAYVYTCHNHLCNCVCKEQYVQLIRMYWRNAQAYLYPLCMRVPGLLEHGFDWSGRFEPTEACCEQL